MFVRAICNILIVVYIAAVRVGRTD